MVTVALAFNILVIFSLFLSLIALTLPFSHLIKPFDLSPIKVWISPSLPITPSPIKAWILSLDFSLFDGFD